jgi:hypothetical protein
MENMFMNLYYINFFNWLQQTIVPITKNIKLSNKDTILLGVIGIFVIIMTVKLGISFIRKIVEFNVLLFISIEFMNYFTKKNNGNYWDKIKFFQ